MPIKIPLASIRFLKVRSDGDVIMSFGSLFHSFQILEKYEFFLDK